MASLLQQAQYATAEHALQKVRQAILKTAIAVSTEESSGDAALDASRFSLATQVLRDPDKWARVMVYGFVTDSRIEPDISDQVILNIISTIWNAYAGVNPNLSA